MPVDAVLAAKSWYSRMFGGIPGKRSNYDAVDLPGMNINISAAPKATVGTKGRMLDHIAFEVVESRGVLQEARDRWVSSSTSRIRRTPKGIGYATLTDPWGTSIELTEGLRGWRPSGPQCRSRVLCRTRPECRPEPLGPARRRRRTCVHGREL